MTHLIKGNLDSVNTTDSRYYLLEPSIDLNKVNENTLFVYVESRDTNYNKRKQIRDTWANKTLYSGY
ncbi:hypothetical protein LSH36_2248g00002, partial [Paralvinella palmiformis]